MVSARIGNKSIPVKKSNMRTIATFSGGRKGRREAGDYQFWTAVCPDGKGKEWHITMRSRISLPYGERFNRMRLQSVKSKDKETRKEYRRLWRIVQKAAYLKPTNLEELKKWLCGHHPDFSKLVKVVSNGKVCFDLSLGDEVRIV